jgi:uncharacterized membrane protein
MRFQCPRVAASRSGHVTVLLVFLLLALLGTTGLVVDTGILLSTHRQAQNVADAAALAAAMDLLSGQNTATATATQYVQTANGLSSATVTVNIPPQQDSYVGDSNYVEVIVTVTVETWFIQVLGGGSSQTRRCSRQSARRNKAATAIMGGSAEDRPSLKRVVSCFLV